MAEGRLFGRTALVTGAGGGIGRGIALELAAQGAAVALHYSSNEQGAAETLELVAKNGGKAVSLQGDLGRAEDCRRVARQACQELGGLDILVNNAGVTEKRDILEVGSDDFERLFNINFRSQFILCQEAVRSMKDRGRGAIVNISSIHAFAGAPGHSVYAATKGAIIAFSRELAVELAPLKIRVNVVAPGHVEVARHFDMPHYTREYGAGIVPWGRSGTPADVARSVAFLVSDDADFITGQVLYVDGGMTARLNLSSSVRKDGGKP